MIVTQELVTALIIVCFIVLGFTVAYNTYAKNRRKDELVEGKQDGMVLTEIGYIKSGIDDIKRHQETQDKQHIEVISRLSAVEASTKQAHKRLDRFEEDKNES